MSGTRVLRTLHCGGQHHQINHHQSTRRKESAHSNPRRQHHRSLRTPQPPQLLSHSYGTTNTHNPQTKSSGRPQRLCASFKLLNPRADYKVQIHLNTRTSSMALLTATRITRHWHTQRDPLFHQFFPLLKGFFLLTLSINTSQNFMFFLSFSF